MIPTQIKPRINQTAISLFSRNGVSDISKLHGYERMVVPGMRLRSGVRADGIDGVETCSIVIGNLRISGSCFWLGESVWSARCGRRRDLSRFERGNCGCRSASITATSAVRTPDRARGRWRNLQQRAGVGPAAGLDDGAGTLAPHRSAIGDQHVRLLQVAAHRAAQAAVAGGVASLGRGGVVDAISPFLTTTAVLAPSGVEQRSDQRGLTGAEEPGDDRHRDAGAARPPPRRPEAAGSGGRKEGRDVFAHAAIISHGDGFPTRRSGFGYRRGPPDPGDARRGIIAARSPSRNGLCRIGTPA